MSRRSASALLAALALGCALACTSLARAEGPAYRVIVNPRNPHTSVDRRFIAQAFLKKATQWSDGEVIRPVDLAANAPARERFTEDVLDRTVAAVKSYWQQLIFSGRAVPPPELDSDEAVIRYVLRVPGAVGYVSGAADVRAVKVLAIR
jgi:ABC-type phosphate transport system substrate-binding protein